MSRHALVGLAAWLAFASGAAGGAELGIATSPMPMLVEAADKSLTRSDLACPPCVSCYFAPGPVSQSLGNGDPSAARTWHALQSGSTQRNAGLPLCKGPSPYRFALRTAGG